MDETQLKFILEALLMSSGEPLSLDRMQAVFEEWERPTKNMLQSALSQLENDYKDRSIELKCLASGFCFQTKTLYHIWLNRAGSEKPAKYSQATLETLAIIAYRQPATRADIEDIRGVGVSSSIIKTLLEREWIRVAGFRDVPGKPAVYVTTKLFLDNFNLANLDELPTMQLEVTNHEQ